MRKWKTFLVRYWVGVNSMQLWETAQPDKNTSTCPKYPTADTDPARPSSPTKSANLPIPANGDTWPYSGLFPVDMPSLPSLTILPVLVCMPPQSHSCPCPLLSPGCHTACYLCVSAACCLLIPMLIPPMFHTF